MLELLLASLLAASDPVGVAGPALPSAPETPTANLPSATLPAMTLPAAAAPSVPAAPEDLAAPIVPPSIATRAFLDEVRNASREQRASRQRAEQERARLEKLLREITAAREALREETARLEALSLAVAARPPPQPEPPVVAADARPAVAPPPGGNAPPAKPPHETLAKTLKGMRPERAAEVVARLDPVLAVSLLRQSRPGDVAAILEKLKPEAAADIVARLAIPEAVRR